MYCDDAMQMFWISKRRMFGVARLIAVRRSFARINYPMGTRYGFETRGSIVTHRSLVGTSRSSFDR